ncbi:MAG: DUF84 family protein [Acidobacteriota bacterium]
MKIAIGTTRKPKVDAVKEAVDIFGRRLVAGGDEIEFVAHDVQSTIASMPLSVKELMEGAQGRAENLIAQLKREQAEADFYIGMEGGFHRIEEREPRMVFLQSWAYVSDGLCGYFGSSGSILVPRRIADRVIDRGIELGVVIDEFADESNIRSRQGTWGILTGDILTRKQSFVVALIAAFAPFYNKKAYE